MKSDILIVEDDPAIRSLLTNCLEAEGFGVTTSGTIQEFERLRNTRHFDLFLIDVGLPDGNGFTLLKSVRTDSNAGIIVLTGRTDEADYVIGLELGADDYISKPFRRRELVARINAVLRRSAMPAPTTPEPAKTLTFEYEFDGYQVSTSARRVLGPDGSEIMLTTAEYEMLAALLHRRGRVLSRDQLMQLVRGRDWEIYDRAVDALVSRLRRKLPPPAGRTVPYIRTIHGLGYGFMD